MSYTFSRRAFFKYSAAAAVAVAGASLLGGCNGQDSNNPVSKKLGGKLTNMQVTASLDAFDLSTGDFQFSVESARVNPIVLSPERFSVSVLDADGKATGVYYMSDDINMGEIVSYTSKMNHNAFPRLYSSDAASVKFSINGFVPLAVGEKVQVQYLPVYDMPTFSMNWIIEQELDTEE